MRVRLRIRVHSHNEFFLEKTMAISMDHAAFFADILILPQWIQGLLGYPTFTLGLVTAQLGIFAVLLAPAFSQGYAEIGSAPAGNGRFPEIRWSVFHALALYDGRRCLVAGLSHAAAGDPCCAFPFAAQVHYRVGPAAGANTCDRRCLQFGTHFRGCSGHVARGHGPYNCTISHHEQLAERTGVNNPGFTVAIANFQSKFNVSMPKALVYYETSLNAQAIVLALHDIFWLSGLICILFTPLIWLTLPGKGTTMGGVVVDGH